jgi:hypothetical protein
LPLRTTPPGASGPWTAGTGHNATLRFFIAFRIREGA